VSALLVINAVLSFTQERRAAGVVEALRRRLQVNARVRRESNWQVIAARELVPGDIVRVRPGDVIPADVKLFTGAVTVDQSALTGESKDEDKASGAVLPSGSVVRRGEGNGVTWIVNKISRTILKAAFMAIAYVVTGKFVVSVFAMLLLTFMTDFAKIALFTDNVGSSRKPETWNIGGLITVSVILGLAMVAEAFLLLWFDWSRFGLATDDNALYTFSFAAAVFCGVLRAVRPRAPRVLVDDAQQSAGGRPDGGGAHGYHPDARGSAWAPAIAVVADPRDLCLCHGLVLDCE
jgi:magnesium-transporting ATPase (P-type)